MAAEPISDLARREDLTFRAAILLIGDELLTGKITDRNGSHAAKALFAHGIELHEVVIVPDLTEQIIAHVVRLSRTYDFVFTSGGIGSTHDDITYHAVASAFGDALILDRTYAEGILREIRKKRPVEDLDTLVSQGSLLLKMATFPAGATVHATPDLWVPLVQLRNVYIFPGIPRLFQTMFDNLLAGLPGRPKVRRIVHTDLVEGMLAGPLATIQTENSDVAIGSYPADDGLPYRVKLSLEGYDEGRVLQTEHLIERMVQMLGGRVLQILSEKPTPDGGD